MLILVALLLAAKTPAPLTDWRAYAGCAAAYQVNAAVPDPDRPASMRAMISETASDYRKAAEGAYRPRAKTQADAAKAVGAEIDKRAAQLKPRSRAEVEKLIDTCPQLPDPG